MKKKKWAISDFKIIWKKIVLVFCIKNEHPVLQLEHHYHTDTRVFLSMTHVHVKTNQIHWKKKNSFFKYTQKIILVPYRFTRTFNIRSLLVCP